jgi:DNA-binding MarR family transcriptional regulator
MAEAPHMTRRAPRGQTEAKEHQHDLIDEIVRLTFATTAVLNKVGADNDLSLTQLRVLGILRDRRARMAELADYLGLDKSTMTGLVDRAVKRGLLERAPSTADRRVVEVSISRDGAALVERIDAAIRQSLSSMTRPLSAAEQRKARDLLGRLLDSAEKG